MTDMNSVLFALFITGLLIIAYRMGVKDGRLQAKEDETFKRFDKVTGYQPTDNDESRVNPEKPPTGEKE